MKKPYKTAKAPVFEMSPIPWGRRADVARALCHYYGNRNKILTAYSHAFVENGNSWAASWSLVKFKDSETLDLYVRSGNAQADGVNIVTVERMAGVV